MLIANIFKAIILGIVEGITEWLPISSTGHLILADEFIKMNMSAAFTEMFNVVIQLGAILAVVVLYFNKLNPFSSSKSHQERNDTWTLWFKVIIACLPAAVIGLPLDDFLEAHFHKFLPVAIMLIVYGIAFIVGASGLKIVKFLLNGNSFGISEIVVLLVGMVTAFVVSIIAIKFLLDYIKRNDFTAFGWYRIVLGIILIGYWLIAM